MLFGGAIPGGGLEVRREPDGSVKLAGRFPYGATATLSDGGRTGRPRKEKFAPRAFAFRVEKPDEEIHLLAGHSFDKPLASKLGGSLSLEDTAEALTFEARIAHEVADTSHGRDTVALISSGLAVGLSPGFRIPPERAVKDAEEVTQEPDDGTLDANGDPRRGALVRTVKAALLFELSIVTRPAFEEATVEERNWNPHRAWRPVHPIEGADFVPDWHAIPAMRWR